MTNPDWPAFKDCTGLRLREGPYDRTEVPMTPNQAVITYQGERYFRMPYSRTRLGDGTWGANYLWADWEPKEIES